GTNLGGIAPNPQVAAAAVAAHRQALANAATAAALAAGAQQSPQASNDFTNANDLSPQ
ncbi:hypothetical protein Pmar_PMAR001036, partial [Perkinsus marinus ATCC 50983]